MHLIIILLLVAVYLFIKTYNKGIYVQLSKKEFFYISSILILSIGLRGDGVDNDYSTYVASINRFLAISEPTFLLIAAFIRLTDISVVLLFLIYAFIGVSCKMRVIHRVSSLPCVSLIIYLSNIILLQDINQIRAGAATAFFLLSIPYLAQRKLRKFSFCILVASLFHFSSLLYFILLFVDDEELTYRKYIFWALLPIVGYAFYFVFDQSIIEMIPISVIRNKLLMYKKLQTYGVDGFAQINLFNPYFLFKLVIYYFLLEYYNILKDRNKDFTLYLKIFGISLFIFPALGAITPILGYRSSDLFACVEILLFFFFFSLFKGEKVQAFYLACYFVLLFSINIFYKHLIYI